METISIIIPTWNSAQTLQKTIMSCLRQTVPVLEVLVCDDGSTDNSHEVVKAIGDNRVIWIASLHSGTPAVPRNNGMSQARGEWFAFCDSDDEWLPTKLEAQLSLLEKIDCKASCTQAVIKLGGIITQNHVSKWKKDRFTFSNILRSNDIVGSSVLIHSSLYKEIGGFCTEPNYASFVDYMYWLRILTKTNFAFVKEPLVIYDDHPQTSLRSKSLSDSDLQNIVIDDFQKWIGGVQHNKATIFNNKIKHHKTRLRFKKDIKNIIYSFINIWKK